MCASAAWAAAEASAEDGAPFVTQLQLPARGVSLEVFAWRGADGVSVEASALTTLGIAAPDSDTPVALSSIAGLSYEEQPGAGAIVITCSAACYRVQHVGVEQREANDAASTSGAYLNYEAELQWTETDGAGGAGFVEATLFGRWGLIESSWIAQTSGGVSAVMRLETGWTIDRPRDGVRVRIGDSVMLGANGAPVRFGGVQIGRHFGLTPSLITYPTPAMSGEAATASTVELYVDGALRARSEVEAGPFVIDSAPVVSGAGEAELVITDVLGRQQTITRPFFVSTALLRPSLSDWSVALGAERRGFGRDSTRYGDSFIAARYRRGVTGALTVEGAFEATSETTTIEAAASLASVAFGQFHAGRAANTSGGLSTASWYYDGRLWSAGVQAERRDGDFRTLGRDHGRFREAAAAKVALNMGAFGVLAFTAAQVSSDGEPDARTLTLSYAPDVADGALSFRLMHYEREENTWAAGISLSFALAGDVSAHANAEYDGDRGATYRVSAQRSVEPERWGWRARASAGASERVDATALSQTALGDSMAQIAYANGVAGVRLRHGGSVGWIEKVPFAGRRIDGAFALVDVGAADVTVSRNRLAAGATRGDGRILVTNLRPYGETVIGIDADDLPLDRALASTLQRIVPAEGAGVVVRFAEAQQVLTETRVTFADGALPPRGAILVRDRDGARFPVGGDGRVVLLGARDGDVLVLEGAMCRLAADSFTLQCAATS